MATKSDKQDFKKENQCPRLRGCSRSFPSDAEIIIQFSSCLGVPIRSFWCGYRNWFRG